MNEDEKPPEESPTSGLPGDMPLYGAAGELYRRFCLEGSGSPGAIPWTTVVVPDRTRILFASRPPIGRIWIAPDVARHVAQQLLDAADACDRGLEVPPEAEEIVRQIYESWDA